MTNKRTPKADSAKAEEPTFTTEALHEGDWPDKEEEESKEDAPKLETPEKKVEVPAEETPRDEEPELETAEEKPEDRRSTFKSEYSYPTWDPVVRGEVSLNKYQIEELELQQHTASNPVDAHAPAWEGREPNSP